jgi:hypothetical protein
MSNYRIKYGIITNNIKCQFGLHHCYGLVETIGIDILFVCIGVQMKKIRKGQRLLTSCGPYIKPPYLVPAQSSRSRHMAAGHRASPGDAHVRVGGAVGPSGRRWLAARPQRGRAGPRESTPAGHVAGPSWLLSPAVRTRARARVCLPGRDAW